MESSDSTQKILGPEDVARELHRREGAKKKLLNFAKYTHSGTWVDGKHLTIICDALEAVERGDIRFLLVETPPRHGKSELSSKKFPAWYMGKHPNKQILATSYSGDLSVDFSKDVLGIVRDPRYQNIFPETKLVADARAARRWKISGGGVYVAAGVGGSITGRGADLAIIDDPVKNREDADSERMRDSVWKWYTSTLLTRLMPGGRIVLIMTRWHEDDLGGRVQESGEWEKITLPGIENEHTPDEKALWPERYPLEELHKIRSIMVKSGRGRDWNALYQQDPAPASGTFISGDWLQERYDERPEPLNIYMASDFAVTAAEEGKDPDSTEHGVFGIGSDDKIYVLDWWHGQTTTDIWIDELSRLILKYKPLCWFGEGGVIRRAIEPVLKKVLRQDHAYCRKEWITPIHDKTIRGRSFQARAASGRIVFPQEIWAQRIIDQCVGFGTGAARHDDAFDVMSLMCLCVDQAHPAILAPGETRARRKRDYGNEQRDELNWKIL